MKKVSFAKMSGAGNDFVVFDKKFCPNLNIYPNTVKKICTRRTGIGADGLIVISDHPGQDFIMDYYNADGSTGTLCGNGARCAIRYAYLVGRLNSNKARFISHGNEYSGEVLDITHVKFYLNEPKDIKLNFEISAASQVIKCSYVNTGSPHVVIDISDNNINGFTSFNDLPVYELGKEIRYLDEFKPGGTNVNFLQLQNNKINIRTYERGVEDETLACGTGATASAIISYFNKKVNPPVSLITRSGDELIVDFNTDGHEIKNLSLTGPADVIFTGEFYSEMFFNQMEI